MRRACPGGPYEGPPALRSAVAREALRYARGPPVDYLDKPSDASPRQPVADASQNKPRKLSAMCPVYSVRQVPSRCVLEFALAQSPMG